MNPELIYKYLENTATDDEMKQVLDWLDADPAHMRELDELDKVMAASVIYGPDVLSPRLREGGAAHFTAADSAAAHRALCRGAGCGGGRRRRSRADACRRPDRRVGAADDGARSACGTVPEHGVAGRHQGLAQCGNPAGVSAGVRRGERRVKVAGEAMFDVEHDPAHPFVVETFACDVEVLGTKFDVTAEEREGLFSAACAAKREGDQPPDARRTVRPQAQRGGAAGGAAAEPECDRQHGRLPLDRRHDQHQGPFVRGADAQIRKELRREDTDRPRPDARRSITTTARSVFRTASIRRCACCRWPRISPIHAAKTTERSSYDNQS